jgi:hypothetical protein
MKTVTAEVENNNLVLANDAIEKLGWRESTRLKIKEYNGKFVVLPRELTQKEIADSACIYLIKHVGDATAVKTPNLRGRPGHRLQNYRSGNRSK